MVKLPWRGKVILRGGEMTMHIIKNLFSLMVVCFVVILVTGCSSPKEQTGPGLGEENSGNQAIGYTEELTEENIIAWALGCSAILAVRNGLEPYEFGMFTRSEMNSLRAQTLMADTWNCFDRGELLDIVFSMTDNGHNESFEKTLVLISVMTDKEFKELVAMSEGPDVYMWPMTKALGEKWGDKGIKAWDWFRLMHLIGWGYVAEYFEIEEAYDLMIPVIEHLRDTFVSWEDANDNYMDGFVWWSRTDLSDPEDSNEYYTRMEIYENLKKDPLPLTLFNPTLWPGYVPADLDSATTAGQNDTDNFLYEDNGDGTCTITGSRWQRGDLAIPGEINGLKVETIGASAFEDAKGFSGVLVIPDSVKTIESRAFIYCSGLTGDLKIPDSVVSLGDSVFEYCSGFDGDLILSKNMKDVSKRAFIFCEGLSGKLIIPDGITRIGPSAFSNCENLSGALVFPTTLTTIEATAFNECAGFTGVLEIPEKLTLFSPANVFNGCTGIESVKVAGGNTAFTALDGILYNKNKSKIEYAPPGFLKNNYSIPGGPEEIARGAFRDCIGLTGALTLPDGIVKIDGEAFLNCGGLDEIILPSDLVSIGRDAFKGCAGIEKIVLPQHMDFIGGGAFAGCTNLSEALFLGDALKKYQKSTFNNCAKDFKIVYDPTKSGWTTPEWNGMPCYPK